MENIGKNIEEEIDWLWNEILNRASNLSEGWSSRLSCEAVLKLKNGTEEKWISGGMEERGADWDSVVLRVSWPLFFQDATVEDFVDLVVVKNGSEPDTKDGAEKVFEKLVEDNKKEIEYAERV